MEPSLVTGTLRTKANGQLFFRRWTPDCQSKGTIVIAHGLGEHSGRYVHVGDFFARAGLCAIREKPTCRIHRCFAVAESLAAPGNMVGRNRADAESGLSGLAIPNWNRVRRYQP